MNPSEHKRKAIVVGLGSHCNAIISIIESSSQYQVEALIDTADTFDPDETKLGYPVKGTLTKLISNSPKKEAPVIFIAIGDNRERARVFHQLREAGYELPNLIAPTAIVHRSVEMLSGNVIGHFCLLNAGAKIGANNIFNNRSTLEHDAQIEDHCHLAPGAILCGKVSVSDHCFIGAGAVVLPNVKLLERTTLGAGAVMHRDAKTENGTYVGVPATLTGCDKTRLDNDRKTL